MREILDALGIRSGAAHTEVMLTDQGLVLVESGARLGGATAPDVVEAYGGVSQTSLLAMSLLDPSGFGGFDDTQVHWSSHVRNVELVNRVAGTVNSSNWVTTLESLPTVVRVVAVASPGTTLRPT